MAFHLDSLVEANRLILSRIAVREEELAARERALTDELTAIENERRSLSSDKETIKSAEAIQARLLGTGQAVIAPQVAAVPRTDGEQARARIGTKRYAMWTLLRSSGPITVEGIAERTGLNVQRVRDQMKSDQPLYVTAGSLEQPGLTLTIKGNDLLTRFENYRRAQGKPLPSLSDTDDANDTNDEDDAGAEAEEAAAEAQKDEAAGTASAMDAPTASIADANVNDGSVFS